MPRKKKKTSPAERRAQEKQRRIEAAGKPKQAGAQEKERQAPAGPQVQKPAPKRAERPSKAAPRSRAVQAPVSNPKYKALQFTGGEDAGRDCARYDVGFPARMDVQALFDAIRKERRDEHGTVYISLNLAEAGPSNYQLSYDYAGGMFIRREKPSKDKAAPLLADLLDRPVQKILACGGWGVMDYYVNIRPADAPGIDADARPYDPSEIIPGT